jgi:hypothetical protein
MSAAAWIVVIALVGFGISAVFSAELGLTRDSVVLAHLTITTGLLIAFSSRHAELLWSHLQRNWRTGVLVAVAIGALLALSVTRQPGSPAPSGLQLVWSLIWLGLVYGLLDALLLNVLPVMVLAREDRSRARRWLGWRVTVLGLAAGAVVTAAYHLGYREYRGRELVQPLIGNTVLTTGYLITGNPATSVIAHVIMHGAAVLHGMETTTQLPPHYQDRNSRGFMLPGLPSGEMEDSDP